MWFPSCVCAFLFLTTSAASRVEDKPELTYSQDGNDLVVRMKVQANGSSHALWTRVVDRGGENVTLYYYVVQNSDIFVRSVKWVTVEWRLPGRKQEGTKVRVEHKFEPTTADLKALLPDLQKLVELGEKNKR